MTPYIEERLWKAKMVRKNKLNLALYCRHYCFIFNYVQCTKYWSPKDEERLYCLKEGFQALRTTLKVWNSFLEERATVTSRRASPLFVGGGEATNDSYHLSILWNTVLKTITLGPHTWAFSALEFLFSLIISPMPPHFLPLEGGTLIGYPCTPVGWFCFCSLRLLQNSNVCPHLL